LAIPTLASRFSLERNDDPGEGIAHDQGQELGNSPRRDEGIGRVRCAELGSEHDIAQHSGNFDADGTERNDRDIDQELAMARYPTKPAGERQRAALYCHERNHSMR
jgi:hypothetical protein